VRKNKKKEIRSETNLRFVHTPSIDDQRQPIVGEIRKEGEKGNRAQKGRMGLVFFLSERCHVVRVCVVREC
jgi:hypothetical protein